MVYAGVYIVEKMRGVQKASRGVQSGIHMKRCTYTE